LMIIKKHCRNWHS